MGLMRSLYAGVSGLRNHQVMMDVIGNNLSNVNTIGYKGSRTTFSETFAQTLRGTSQNIANMGGTNPMQVGLGMSLTTIDTLYNQGNIETTGQTTDLAIQGDGFFVVSDGSKNYYTRAGNFQFDADGKLIMPGSGVNVQGYLADKSGEIESGTPLTDIKLPFGQKIAAKATSEIGLSGNLDASAKPLGNILSTDSVYAIETGDSDVNGLLATGSANDSISGMTPNSSEVEITVNTGSGDVTKKYKYVSNDNGIVGNSSFHSLQDLIDEINNHFSGSNLTASLNTAGAIEFTNGSGGNMDLTISSNNLVLDEALHSGLTTLAAGGSHVTDEFSHVAKADDLLTDLRNADGQSLGLMNTDVISLNGIKGETNITPQSYTVNATSTYQDFATSIESAFELSNDRGVQIDADDGGLIINADGGTTYELSALDFRATDAAGTTARTGFNDIYDSTTGNYSELQEAKDVKQSSSLTVNDSQGNQLELTVVFTKDTSQANRWLWKVQAPDQATITGGGSGYVDFNEDGSFKSFEMDDGSSMLQLDPGTGSNELLSISLDSGEFNSFEGITQLAGSGSSVISASQNGHTMGSLEQISVDNTGTITGAYSNGMRQVLGAVALANFNNPNGLYRSENNLYTSSSNTGDPIISTAGKGISATVVAGALEQSNVDMAEQFTKMIVAQRGFQANARIITTSDDMLSEVSNLKR